MAVPDLNWYFSYNLFRLAGITQGIAGRIASGTAANAKAIESAKRTVPLSKASWEYAQKAGATKISSWRDPFGSRHVAMASPACVVEPETDFGSFPECSRKPPDGCSHGGLHDERHDYQGSVGGDELRPGDAGAGLVCDGADRGACIPSSASCGRFARF